MVKRTGDDKTAILVWVGQTGCAVQHAAPLARRNINLTRIESRPSQQKAWSFLHRFPRHMDDAVVQETLEEVGDHARNIKVLGSFPRRSQE